MNRLLSAAIAAALVAPVAAADADRRPELPPDVASSTTTLPRSAFPSWTEIRGKVESVDRANGHIKIRQTGDDILHDVTVTPAVTIHDEKMAVVLLKNVKKGQTVILRNQSTATPDPAPLTPR
jgi:hypothetical protein